MVVTTRPLLADSQITGFSTEQIMNDSAAGYSDDLFHISDCVAVLLSRNCWIDNEHVEPGRNGGLTWIVACSRNGTRFVADGRSPLEAYRQAIRLAT